MQKFLNFTIRFPPPQPLPQAGEALECESQFHGFKHTCNPQPLAGYGARQRRRGAALDE